MKKNWLPLILSILLVPAFSGAAFAQTPDEIIDKVVTALGGRDALSKLTSRRGTGTVVVSTPNGELNGTFEIDDKAPNKQRTHIELDLTPMGMPDKMMIDQKFDGVNASSVNSMQGEQELSAVQLQNARNRSFPSPLLTYKTLGIAFEVLPKETIDGKSYLVLRGTPKQGYPTKIYIDPDTYLPARVAIKSEVPGVGEVEQVTVLTDYRAVDGIKSPFKTVNQNALQTATFTYTKIEHNVALPDSLFQKAPAPAAR